MPFLKKLHNRCLKKRRLFEKYVEHCFRKGMKPFPAPANQKRTVKHVPKAMENTSERI